MVKTGVHQVIFRVSLLKKVTFDAYNISSSYIISLMNIGQINLLCIEIWLNYLLNYFQKLYTRQQKLHSEFTTTMIEKPLHLLQILYVFWFVFLNLIVDRKAHFLIIIKHQKYYTYINIEDCLKILSHFVTN